MKLTEKQLRKIVRESLEEFNYQSQGDREYDLAGLTAAVKGAFTKEIQGTLGYITPEEFQNIMKQVFNTLFNAGKIQRRN